MADMSTIIDELLKAHGITGAKMCSDLGMSKSFMTELRKGRAKSIKVETAQKIADYFGVSLDHLLGNETKNAPTENSERDVLDEVDIGFYSGYKELDEADKEVLRDMVRVMRERKARKNEP